MKRKSRKLCMNQTTSLPPALSSYLGEEQRDFVVRAGRVRPLRKLLAPLFFGVILLAFFGAFALSFFLPLIQGEEMRLLINGVPTVVGPHNWTPLLVPAVIVGMFFLLGGGMLLWVLSSLFQEGGYFVGTPTRLVHFRRGKIRSIDWEQFSGEIEVYGDNEKGTLVLGLRTGRMVRKRNGGEAYVPQVVYLTDIPHVYEVEKMCRKRIQENDPTPPISNREAPLGFSASRKSSLAEVLKRWGSKNK